MELFYIICSSLTTYEINCDLSRATFCVPTRTILLSRTTCENANYKMSDFVCSSARTTYDFFCTATSKWNAHSCPNSSCLNYQTKKELSLSKKTKHLKQNRLPLGVIKIRPSEANKIQANSTTNSPWSKT